MSVFNYKTGLGNSSAYQVSAAPCVIRGTATQGSGGGGGGGGGGGSTPGAVQEVNFTNVTNFIQISASADLSVGFSSLGITANDNYFVVSEGLSSIYHWRASSIYLQNLSTSADADYAIIAGLTTVPAADLSNNWSGSAGVG